MSSSHGPGKPQSESALVIPMTAQLFARGTKQSPTDPREQEKALQDELVLIRHGERQDHADKSWRGNALLPLHDPPLSDTGRRQAFETALHYYARTQGKSVEERINGTFSYLLVSPFHRCLETAIILNVIGFQGRLALFVEPQLSDWHQPKVFRAAPTLAGYFGVPGRKQRNAKALLFYPQLEAVRTNLLPFFRARQTDEKFLETHTVAPALASRWASDLEAWVDAHPSLPVWTGASAHDALQDAISDLKSGSSAAAASTTPEPAATPAAGKKGGKGGHTRGSATSSPPPQPSMTGPGGEPAIAQCGVRYPESKSDLAKRCELFLTTHFCHDDALQTLSMVPQSVTLAVEAERREKLPKYFQRFEQRPESVRQQITSAALLPPMRVMAVTHADVVSTVLRVSCPRYRADNEGFSVPSASVTRILRYNNYYRIPPTDERTAAASAGGGRGGQQHGKGRGGGGRGKTSAPSLQRPRIMTLQDKEERERQQAPLPTEWHVEGTVGSVDMLHTRVVIHYS